MLNILYLNHCCNPVRNVITKRMRIRFRNFCTTGIIYWLNKGNCTECFATTMFLTTHLRLSKRLKSLLGHISSWSSSCHQIDLNISWHEIPSSMKIEHLWSSLWSFNASRNKHRYRLPFRDVLGSKKYRKEILDIDILPIII